MPLYQYYQHHNYQKNNDLTADFLFQWMKEKDKNQIMYLKLDENDNVACFAILHKTDFDQYNTQKNPHVLDYIYTYKNFRNNKHAQSLINEIKKTLRIYRVL